MNGPGAFVIHLLAYLFGTRLQFSAWWFDSRVSVTRGKHNIFFSHEVVEDFISHCFTAWAQWDEKHQSHITNLLFMHCRAPAYEWDWESFAIEYMVFDGCYRLAVDLGKVKNHEVKGHGDRMNVMCRVFGIPREDQTLTKIKNMRNQLFHESLWDSNQPCTSRSQSAFMQPLYLRKFNQRILPALFDYKNAYVSSSWSHMLPCSFSRMDAK